MVENHVHQERKRISATHATRVIGVIIIARTIRAKADILVIDGNRVTASSIFSWRIDDLTHLSEVEPDHVTPGAVVDDDVARTGMCVRL